MKFLYHHRTRGKGAEGVHIRGVVSGLRELGHQVNILSLPGSDPEYELPEQQKPQQNTQGKSKGLFHYISALTKYFPEFLFEISEILFNIIAWWRLRKRYREQPFDVIYERYSLFLFVTVWWANRHNIPIVLEINDSCLVHRVRPLTFKKIAKRFEQWIFSNATGLVFISTQFQTVASQHFPRMASSLVSPNAADLSQFVLKPGAGESLRKALGINEKVVLGYVGAFVHWHGIDWFVDAIAPKLRHYPDLVLLLVGDGVSFENIKSIVERHDLQEQIILPGRVAHNLIPDYLAATDFGILPDSNDYGSPMKLFEFMAMEKAMVVPDFSPIAEVIDDNETGWLFKANDRDACIDKVLELAGQKDKLLQVGKAARKYIEAERQWKHNAQQILQLLNAKK